jgi:hypothetical protein
VSSVETVTHLIDQARERLDESRSAKQTASKPHEVSIIATHVLLV